jgi:hypothetical protein
MDSIVALALVYFVVKESPEAVEEVRRSVYLCGMKSAFANAPICAIKHAHFVHLWIDQVSLLIPFSYFE